jgi:agmatinase
MEKLEDLFLPSPNFAGLSSPYSDLSNAKVVILPVPYDSTTEWQSGTRHGPRAIINSSQYLELYDIELDLEIYKVGIHTLPSIRPLLSSPESMIERVYRVTHEMVRQNKFPVMLGGEHSLSLGMVKALKEKFNDICVLQLDAHADLRDEYLGTRYGNACVMRRIHELCPIVQVGVRSLSLEERQFINQNKIPTFCITNSSSDLPPTDNIMASLGNNVYVSIDLDVFDPSIMPAVGTPEPAGMHWNEVVNLLSRAAQKKQIIGFDLVELCPGVCNHTSSFVAAKLAYKFIGYATASQRSKVN